MRLESQFLKQPANSQVSTRIKDLLEIDRQIFIRGITDSANGERRYLAPERDRQDVR